MAVALASAEQSVKRLIDGITTFNERKPHTIAQYQSTAMRFLNQSSAPPTRDDVLRFIASLKSQGHKSYAFGVIRRLFYANEWSWPFPPRTGPSYTPSNQAVLTSEEIAKLIGACISGDIPRHLQGYVALSTIYGLRRFELGQFYGDQRNITRFTVTIKGGSNREHTVPVVLRPYLVFPEKPLGLFNMSETFFGLTEMVGIPYRPHMGWHAIRRRLATELPQVCDPLMSVFFMHWKTRTASQTTGLPKTFFVYQHPGVEVVDKAIFGKHPYLKLWGERCSDDHESPTQPNG